MVRPGLGSVSGASDICLSYSEINPNARSLSSVSKHNKQFPVDYVKIFVVREVTDGESACGRTTKTTGGGLSSLTTMERGVFFCRQCEERTMAGRSRGGLGDRRRGISSKRNI